MNINLHEIEIILLFTSDLLINSIPPQALVQLVRGEQPIGGEDKELRHHSNSGGGAQHYHQDGGYTVHYNLFKTIVANATLWGEAHDRVDQLSTSAFNLLDTRGNHSVSFKSVCWLVSVINGGDAARHLRLLYWLHLACPPEPPPAMVGTPAGEAEPEGFEEATEQAEEAENFFVQAEEEGRKRKEELKRSLSICESLKSPSVDSEESPSADNSNYSGNIWSPPKEEDPWVLYRGAFQRDSYREYERRFLPPMTQTQFINLWRTVYAFFAAGESQEIFGALARVGSLLLQTGDVGRQLRQKQLDGAPLSPTNGGKGPTNGDPSGPSSGSTSPTLADWSITFDQFLANVANEEALMKFFETKMNITENIRKILGGNCG